MLEVITSVRNPRVVQAASLSRRRERRATGRYLVEGPNAVTEVVAEGHAETVFVVEDRYEGFAGHDDVVVVADHVLERLADSRSPQGVVAVARIVTTPLADVVGDGVLVVLDAPADPGNVGTIVRTADAAGAHAVVVAGAAVDPWNPKAVRASAGAVATLPVVVGVSADEVLRTCRTVGQRTVALDVAGEARVDEHGVLAPPVALLFGNEAHGLPDDVRGACDVRASIPLYGPVDSLNLAAAVAVVAYAAAAETPA